MSFPYGESQALPKASHRRTLSSFTPLSTGASRNSSINGLWAEDYYESHSLETAGTSLGHKDGLSLAFPEPATLCSRPSPLSDALTQGDVEPSPRPTRSHQRSLTSLLPFRSRTRDDSKSPERINPRGEKPQRGLDKDFMSTPTGDNYKPVQIEEKQRGGLSSWFSGSSAPISLGIPVTGPETSSPSHESPLDEASPPRESAKLRKRTNLPSVEAGSNNIMPTKAPAGAAPSRFNFFSQKSSQKQTIQLPEHMIQDDDLLTLDIHAALFPHPPSAQDSLSPSAFKDLLSNAEGLLLRIQTAYKLRTLSLHELSADKEAQDDELEEAETRARCLKSQLEEMSNRVAEQDRVIEDLVEQVATEKQARTEEKLAREKSIALIQASHQRHLSETEDLGFTKTPRPRAWRTSGGSTSTEGDSDAELASPTDSVFTRSMSPAPTITSMLSSTTCMSADTSPEVLQAAFARVVKLQPAAAVASQHRSPAQQQQQQPGSSSGSSNTFQKIMRGVSPPAGCENCRGADAGVAWDTVGLLRMENRGLKERVGSLEDAVESALDLCSNTGRF